MGQTYVQMAVGVLACVLAATPGMAQRFGSPRVVLVGAAPLTLPGEVDSNSPAIRETVAGQPALVVLTSINGRPSRAVGPALGRMSEPAPVDILPWPGGGVWMEAVIRSDDGTWYGFYHNERGAPACSDTTKVTPRIGAARSTDFGATWVNLGILIEAAPRTYRCDTKNHYFVSGVGDLTAVLDRHSTFVYLYFSQYLPLPEHQGVAVARLAWADRDAPVGKTDIWSYGAWLPGRRFGWPPSAFQLLSGPDATTLRWLLPNASAIFPTPNGWHGPDDGVDAFWGPSIHWNTYLQQYVMLLNHARDERFGQDGVYVSFTTDVGNPDTWSTPVRILNERSWYPQILGLDPAGTDKEAGQVARLFVAGRSDYLIRFVR